MTTHHRHLAVPKITGDTTPCKDTIDRCAQAMSEGFQRTEFLLQLVIGRKIPMKQWMQEMLAVLRRTWGTPIYFEKRVARRPDCKAGCSHCCRTTVGASPMEVFMVASQLCGRADADVAEMRARVTARAGAIRNRTLAEREGMIECGALGNDGTCQAYVNRPFVCRGLISFDVEACKAGTPPVDRDLIMVVNALQSGAMSAMVQAGLDVVPGELTLMLDKVLDDFEGSVTRWLAGEKIFGDAQLPELAARWEREQAQHDESRGAVAQATAEALAQRRLPVLPN